MIYILKRAWEGKKSEASIEREIQTEQTKIRRRKKNDKKKSNLALSCVWFCWKRRSDEYKMLLSLHLNVWQYKCINIPIYFYMFMIYRCLCVCERTCLYITCTLTNLTYSQANAIHILNPLPLQKKALALHLRTVSICLRTGGYWRARGDISICNHSILNLIYLGFLSLPQTKACTHTHTHIPAHVCVYTLWLCIQ